MHDRLDGLLPLHELYALALVTVHTMLDHCTAGIVSCMYTLGELDHGPVLSSGMHVHRLRKCHLCTNMVISCGLFGEGTQC
jgi:hypothetical protein